MSLSDLPEIAPPGTPAFFPSLLSRICLANPTLPIDSVILQSILLCLIAGDKHLILRTQLEDVSLVLKLATVTLTIFSSPTHRLKIRSSQPPPPLALLRSLFLPNTPPTSTTSPSIISPHGHKRRSASGLSLSSTKFKFKHGALRPPLHSSSVARSTSSPGMLTTTASIPAVPSFDAGHMAYASTSSSTTERVELKTYPSGGPSGFSLRPLRIASVPPVHRTKARNDITTLMLPQALVVSGLEHAPRASQRAFLRALREKRVILESECEDEDSGGRNQTSDYMTAGGEDGVWNLPDGFMVVYVCALDSRERPNICRSLLDQFAMSATINLSTTMRQSVRQYFSHRSPSPSPSMPIALTLTTATSSALPIDLLPILRQLHAKVSMTPELSLYTSDLFSAVRHYHQLDGTFLTARARKDADGLIKAARVVGGDLTGVELMRGLAGSVAGKDDGERRAAGWSDLPGPDDHQHPSSSAPPDIPTWDFALDVSEADVARVVPRILSHRLKVRNGPEDEILRSMLYGAVGEHEGGRQGREKQPTVKDILVRILSEV